MPRPLRIHLPGGFYHATLRGNHRQDIFKLSSERHLLNKIVTRALGSHSARLHAYCWMTNHLHFLVQIGATPLGALMRQIGSEYARAYQQSLDTTGHLFENRHYAALVDTDSYLLEAIRYVHQNPVRAGLVNNAARYPWSSHRVYLGEISQPWVTTEFALAQLSGDPNRAVVLYRAFIDETPPADVAEELAALDRGAPLLGKPEFEARIVAREETRATLHSLVDEACRHFHVSPAELRSPARTSRLVQARAWVAHAATRHGLASLSAIARELHRDESTLRSAMRKYAGVLDSGED